MSTSTLLKVLLMQQHLQRYESFRTEYERVAYAISPQLVDTAPSKAQYYRWLTGQIKSGTPYPDACRVLEKMFPEWRADELFTTYEDGQEIATETALTDTLSSDDVLGSIPHSFLSRVLQGAWVTSYQFGTMEKPKYHSDIVHINAVSKRHIRAVNNPPEPRSDKRSIAFHNEIQAQLVNRHLVGYWRNTNDTRYFGTFHLAVLPGEIVMEGHYTGFSSDIHVTTGRWKWAHIDPSSFTGTEFPEITLRNPREIHEIINSHSQYDPPLTLEAVKEKR